MDFAINKAPVITPEAMVEQVEVSEGMRIARNCTLNEMPGLVFGIMTVVYIVAALAGLAP